MKKILVLVASVFAFISCEKAIENQYIVTGTAKGVENGKKMFIELQGEMGEPISKDTAIVENGKFEFKGQVKDLDIAIIKLEGSQQGIPFVFEEGKTEITFDKDSLQKSKISGTYNNEKFQEFNDKSASFGKKMMQFQKDNNEKMQAAQQAQDTVVINKIMKEYKVVQEEMNTFSKDFVKNNPKSYISLLLLESFINNQTAEIDEVQKSYDKLDKSLLENKHAKNIKKAIEAATAITIGKPAPEFSAPSPEGKTISLKESLGKVTIIDFWASWCKPCRLENPNVVAMYNELHEKGLNIIGISLDKDADKWKQAIADDGLVWNHVSNLKFWQDPIAEQYNVKSIPATFILDGKGNIVAKDLRGDELKAKIIELLGQ
ncbi:redoxin domain-containing protein [Flavobacterium jejuense]|uniref:Redoxin domain-containing protein n=1 Tax=Flavobacterium jejuense TaxID=1544455 RepID=A0ABX0IQ16_9FLAO|nr:redoxin domain-containing protein [Flavobacterium jejuense]NHN24889.1 redoxin domain-containing protein [Flavobacterium jejuense]